MTLDFKTNDAFELIVVFDNKTELKWVDAITRVNSKHIFKPKYSGPYEMIFPSFENYEFLSKDTSPVHLRQMFYDITTGSEEFKNTYGEYFKVNVGNIFYNKITEKFELFPFEKSDIPASTQLLNLILELSHNIFVPDRDTLEIELNHAFAKKQKDKFLSISSISAECIVYVFKQAQVQSCRCFFLILDLLLRCIAEDMNINIELVDRLTQIANSVLYKTNIKDSVDDILEKIGMDILYSDFERYSYHQLAVRYTEVLSQLNLQDYFVRPQKNYVLANPNIDMAFKDFIKTYIVCE